MPSRRASRAQRASQGRLVVLANRLPLQRVRHEGGTRWQRSPGGLVAAMDPILQRRGGCWVGWSGGAGGDDERFEIEGLEMRSLALSRRDVECFYNGFSNATLWPLYHAAVRPPVFDRRWWPVYQDVNRRFADGAAQIARESDLLWVHDYHLQLVPRLLRERRPELRIGFFLHIPFPPVELFSRLPWREEILRGLLGADVVGFQRRADAVEFAKAARHFVGTRHVSGRLEHEGRRIVADSFPISIDFDLFEELARDPGVEARARSLRESVGADRKIILSVDRLDYTKGIEKRLIAYEDLLRRKALSPEQCVLIQVAVPSREQVDAYADLRAEVEELVGRINGQFSTPGRVAVHYFRRNLQRRELVAYYRAADVMLVTPVKDGMNLVAKEYAAARHDHRGVLVLSEFAGASVELSAALIVNPYDIDAVSEALERALVMTPGEMRRRMAHLRRTVKRNDVYAWSDRFVAALEQHDSNGARGGAG